MWLKKTRRYRYLLTTLAVLISLGLLLSSLPLGALGTAEASVTDDLAARLIKIYAFIDNADKPILQDRQNKVASLVDVSIIKPAYDKLPDPAKSAFGSDVEALDMVKDAGKITYSSDPNVLKGKLDAYHLKWGPRVAAAFAAVGHSGVKIEDLEELALDTEAEIPGVIDLTTLANLINNWKTNPQAVENELTKWLKDALQKALNKPGNKDIKDALTALNLNVDDLVGIKTRLVKAVDAPGYEGEKALAKAYLRSKAVVTAKVNGVDKGEISKAKPLNMHVGDKAAIELRVFNWPLQDLVNWGVYSGPADVITLSSPTITANKTGTVEVRGYSYKGDLKANIDTDWICRFDVNVTSAPSRGDGGVPSCLGVEKLTPVEAAVDVELDVKVSVAFKKEIEAVSATDLAKIIIKDDKGKALEGVKASIKDKILDLEHDKFSSKTKYTVTIPERCVKSKTDSLYNCKIEWSFTTKEEPKPPACVFNDLTKEHWAYECIMTLCEKGIVAGYPDKTFRPENNITRAEFTKLLAVALRLAKETPGEPTFKDVKPANWYYEWVEAAAKAGLVKGYENGEFRPDAKITREEIAAILVRALGKQDAVAASAKEKTAFQDDQSISSWARGSVVVAAKEGLIRGYPDGTFGPKKNATRAEACAMVSRFLAKK